MSFQDSVGWIYSEKVRDHFLNPRNVLEDESEKKSADGFGEAGSPICGDLMQMWIWAKENKIIKCRWKTFGCASAIASTSVLSEMVTKNSGMEIEQAEKLTPKDILKNLGGLPSKKIHCSVLGDQALRAAILDFKKQNN